MLKRDWRAQAYEVLELDAPADDRPAFNLMTPRSRCPNCESPIAGASQHSCRQLALHCADAAPTAQRRYQSRYPLVELLTAVASIVVIAKFGYTWVGAARRSCSRGL